MPPTLAAMTMKFQKVTRAPPSLSAIHPPTGRMIAPTSGPRNAYWVGFTPGNWDLMRSGIPAEYPMKEPKVPR